MYRDVYDYDVTENLTRINFHVSLVWRARKSGFAANKRYNALKFWGSLCPSDEVPGPGRGAARASWVHMTLHLFREKLFSYFCAVTWKMMNGRRTCWVRCPDLRATEITFASIITYYAAILKGVLNLFPKIPLSVWKVQNSAANQREKKKNPRWVNIKSEWQ